MKLTPLATCTSGDLHVDVELDGPVFLRDGSFALFISLQGKQGGAMPSPAEVHWGRDVPNRMRTDPAHLFFRRPGANEHLYLGRIAFLRAGQPSRDGYKISFRLIDPLPEATWRGLLTQAATPPPPPPDEALAALTARSTTAERVAALRSFIERWYGGTDAPAPPLPPDLPPPLRELFQLVAARKLFHQNRLVRAEDLKIEDGKMTFYIENQGACAWSFEPGPSDPPVFIRGSSRSHPHVQEAVTLSGFLLQVIVLEAVYGAAPFFASTDGASEAELQKLKRRVKPLPLPAWSDGTEFLASGGIVGFTQRDGDRFRVELAARDPAPLEAISGLLSGWPRIGF